MTSEEQRIARQLLERLNEGCARARDEGEDVPDWIDELEDDVIGFLQTVEG